MTRGDGSSNDQRGRFFPDQRGRFLVDSFQCMWIISSVGYSFIHLKIKYPDFLSAVSQLPNKLSSFALVLGAPCFF
jgi:hypothetical protein